MGKVFKGQTALRIVLRTFIDLDDVISAVIKYRKPNGKTGEFSAGVSDVGEGSIFHEITEGEIDMSGWWAFWAFITFADGRSAAGETAKVFIWNEGR
jgi:hypothetical protein